MRQVVDSVCELVRNITCSLGWFHEWLAGDSSLWYTIVTVRGGREPRGFFSCPDESQLLLYFFQREYRVITFLYL